MSTLMRASIVLAVLATSAAATARDKAPAKAQARVRAIRMQIGQDKGMSFTGTTRVNISDPKVADVKPLGGDAFFLYAVGVGKTRLEVERKQRPTLVFDITVTAEPPAPEPTAAAGPADIRLRVGQRKQVSLAGFSRIAIEDPHVLGIEPSGDDTIALTGTGPGRSWLSLSGDDKPERVYQVEVTAGGPDEAPAPTSPK